MTRNAKVGEYIIVNATGDKFAVKGADDRCVIVKDDRDGMDWPVFHTDYTLVEDTIVPADGQHTDGGFYSEIPNRVEDTMKAEDIDLSVDKVFNPPIEGFEFKDYKGDWVKNDRLYAVLNECVHKFITRCSGQVESNSYSDCRPIAKPEPKTRPMTEFERLKLDAIYKTKSGMMFEYWPNNTDVRTCLYCLRVDFRKAENLDDIEWMKMEVKE